MVCLKFVSLQIGALDVILIILSDLDIVIQVLDRRDSFSWTDTRLVHHFDYADVLLEFELSRAMLM